MLWYHYVLISLGALLFLYLILSYFLYRKVFITFNKKPRKFVDHTSDFYSCSYDWFEKIPKDDVYIRSYDNLKLHGYYIPPLDKNTKNIAIIIHGYQSRATDMIVVGKMYSDLGFKVLLIDLRAHGESEGNFTSMGHYEKYDLKKWINFALRSYGANSKILLHGVSMGAAMSMLVMEKKIKQHVDFLVLDSGFTYFSKTLSQSLRHSFFRIGILGVSLFTYLFQRYTLRKIAPLKAMKKIDIPLLIIHGEKDNPVPIKMANELYAASPSKNKNFLVVSNAPHAKAFEVNKDLVMNKIITCISHTFSIKKTYIKNCE